VKSRSREKLFLGEEHRSAEERPVRRQSQRKKLQNLGREGELDKNNNLLLRRGNFPAEGEKVYLKSHHPA